MIKIDSCGNKQIANAMLDQSIEKIRHAFENKQPLFLAYEHESICAGNVVDLLAKIGVGVEGIFTEVQEKLGVTAANVLFDSFIKALTDVRQKNSRG